MNILLKTRGLIMDNKFKFTLPGWKLFLSYGLPIMVLMIGFIMFTRFSDNTQASSGFLFQILGFQAIFMITFYLLYFIVIKLVINNISHREGDFNFSGSFGKFVWIIIRDGVLSLATLGIYSFWFMENMTRFLMENTRFGERKLEFHGKGGDLFKRFLIFFLPFLIPYLVVMASSFMPGFTNSDQGLGYALNVFVAVLFYYLGYLIYGYKAIEWILDLNCGEFEIDLRTEFWPTVFFLLKQFGLMVITLGIFSPAALTNIIKYYINHVHISDGVKVVGIRNEVSTTSSWGYLFGQLILSIITLYIYVPWATVRVLRWFLESTEFDGFEEIEDEYEEEPEAVLIEQDLDEPVIEVKAEIEGTENIE